MTAEEYIAWLTSLAPPNRQAGGGIYLSKMSPETLIGLQMMEAGSPTLADINLARSVTPYATYLPSMQEGSGQSATWGLPLGYLLPPVGTDLAEARRQRELQRAYEDAVKADLYALTEAGHFDPRATAQNITGLRGAVTTPITHYTPQYAPPSFRKELGEYQKIQEQLSRSPGTGIPPETWMERSKALRQRRNELGDFIREQSKLYQAALDAMSGISGMQPTPQQWEMVLEAWEPYHQAQQNLTSMGKAGR